MKKACATSLAEFKPRSARERQRAASECERDGEAGAGRSVRYTQSRA
ncbi:MAG: hypothetical protein M3209_09375 [Acidobacteriota bacterium]|nr:hypothetical protein [Acidobacteriota bacterium]